MNSFKGPFNEFVELVRSLDEYAIDNLPQYVKPCSINSPTFVHESIANEQMMPDLYNNIYNLYVGYILTALKLDSKISGSRTVRDILGKVSSNADIGTFENLDDINELFLTGSLEAKESKYIESKVKHNFPTGRIVEVELQPKELKETIRVNVHVQLTPRFISDSVLEQFILSKINLSIKNRYYQYKANEISFWRDFVFQIDRLDKLSKSLKEDKSGSLREMLRNHNKSVFQRLAKFFTVNKSHNISNKIFIVEENKFKKFCHNVGLNVNKYPDRQKIFNTLYGMLIVLIDPMYNNVTIYANSFDNPTQLTYNQLKDSSSSDKLSLMDVMNALSQNKMPTF